MPSNADVESGWSRIRGPAKARQKQGAKTSCKIVLRERPLQPNEHLPLVTLVWLRPRCRFRQLTEEMRLGQMSWHWRQRSYYQAKSKF